MTTCWDRLSKASVSIQSIAAKGTVHSELYLRFITWMNLIVRPHHCWLLQHRSCFSSRFTSLGVCREQSFVLSATRLWNEHTMELYRTISLLLSSSTDHCLQCRRMLLYVFSSVIHVLVVFCSLCSSVSTWDHNYYQFSFSSVKRLMVRNESFWSWSTWLFCLINRPNNLQKVCHTVLRLCSFKVKFRSGVVAYKVNGKTLIDANRYTFVEKKAGALWISFINTQKKGHRFTENNRNNFS